MKLHDDAQRRTIVEILVPHAPAWECSSGRSASDFDCIAKKT
ncbi:Predicted molybdopterin-dependent oxidoreductase YjgC [Pseudomonas syringae pv. actinidiae]|uniref:Predicted molybdopterin-dependent oxidoreductase YjgC n=1 Tax=Pseudomonas syringae pv. actinidiae TaxID=103796 RepID=A0AAN4Q3J2_PSESF|nr:Predicted molybdopterin-dependent oxidoreductase YjgC [Pseudomonas syringae pv. actinidiae]